MGLTTSFEFANIKTVSATRKGSILKSAKDLPRARFFAFLNPKTRQGRVFGWAGRVNSNSKSLVSAILPAQFHFIKILIKYNNETRKGITKNSKKHFFS